MKILVTGAKGQLGRVVVAQAAERGHEVVGTDIDEVPVDDRVEVVSWVLAERPDMIVHCAAYTDVDGCEGDPDLANRVNGDGTQILAEVCASAGSGLVYISTDFVFDGQSERPYRVDDVPAPISVYGSSKLRGERAVLSEDRDDFYVVRTSWVFGPGGKNFPAAILARAKSGQPLRVVDDQRGCPTLTMDLAGAVLDLVERRAEPGIYHATNHGDCTWFEFAVAILEAAGLGDVEVGRMASSELDRPAPRPEYSVLDCSRLTEVLGGALPNYRDALQRYLREELS